MSVNTYLEEAIEDIVYEGLGEWCVPNISDYSLSKSLFPYQVNAVKNAIKVLNRYYSDEKNGKKNLLDLCSGIDAALIHNFDIQENDNNKENPRFARLKNWYDISKHNSKNIIAGWHFFNRMCFWMATASGKTLVLIKLIEIIDYLQKHDLLPPKSIMALFPSEKIQHQFAEAVEEYNLGKMRPIRLLSLKDYEEEQRYGNMDIDIKVYYYRSDLLSDQEKTKKVDTVTYDNGGNWYIFMDEAHKGDKDDSLRQDYITIMSRNGFLFNFSATFTDNLDFATTCFNYNLEKFIEAGYGKNVYLSKSKYTFKRKTDDFSEEDKQLQVLKSLITYSLVKGEKAEGYYHNPLMVTLVNEVNTEDSDTDLFFTELAKIANQEVEDELFNKAKRELFDEFVTNKDFQFGTEKLNIEGLELRSKLDGITFEKLLQNVYNATTPGKIEIVEGEKGKEFALQLVTSAKPFALFRIGDATQYINSKLTSAYLVKKTFDNHCYFDELNSNAGEDINLLIGSRMFYEGWDSNRPNVMNFINIGTSADAKKYVLQSLGRGVRIEPVKNERRRLKPHDSHKKQLLETLFVFATNRNAVNAILDTMDTQKAKELNIELKESDKKFDLLIPYYKEDGNRRIESKFKIPQQSYEQFKKYLCSFSDELLTLLFDVNYEEITLLREAMRLSKKIFDIKPQFEYKNMQSLFCRVVKYLRVKDKCVGGIKTLEDEIIHFKHIKIDMDKWTSAEIEKFTKYVSTADEALDIDALTKAFKQDKITANDFASKVFDMQNDKEIKNLRLKKISEHYYLPLILSDNEKIDYIKHIINIRSEVQFIDNLSKYVQNKGKFDYKWLFSKVDQTIDDIMISMPYFAVDNVLHNFYPDFIFWQKKGKKYRVTFVDPKGTEYATYLSKVDSFERLFRKGGKPIVFQYKGLNITFNLCLVYDEDSGHTIPAKYKEYWMSNEDFSWLDFA